MKKNRLTLFFTILMLIINMILPTSITFADSSDKTSALTDFTATIKQGSTVFEEGDTLDSTLPITIEISFGVPVIGDDPEPANPVYKGDTASFELSNAFNLVSGSTIALNMGDINVAHVTFVTDPTTHMVTANVVFDGEDSVFDGTSNTVTCDFSASFEYDASNVPGSGGDFLISILEKTYTVNVPPEQIIYDVTKNGVVDLANKTIEWTVNIGATQGEDSIDLAGYIFSDDLTTVGNYVSDSFKIDDVTSTPTINANILSYTFLADSTSPKVITFKTEIPDSKYYVNTSQSVTNSAKLLDSDNTEMDVGQVTVNFTPKWIEKAGTSNETTTGVYNPTNRTITWTITANQMEASLENVIITDVLPTGLTFGSASWQAWNGTDWDTAQSITPNANSEYLLGDISTKVQLVIISNVPDVAYMTKRVTYTNAAAIRWDGLPTSDLGSGNVNVGIGFNAITKTGSLNASSQTANWSITVDTRGQTVPDLKVYDLLVYASSGFNFTGVTGVPVGLNTSDLTIHYDQSYINDSFTSVDGLNITVYPLVKNGVVVADLLEISGFSDDSSTTFSFSTDVRNFNTFLSNQTKSVYNTASLFSGNTKLTDSTKRLDYASDILSKDLVKREAIVDPAAGVNSEFTTNASAAFDYTDKSVIYRISVNADDLDVSGVSNGTTTLGAITLTDTLPEGWEFVEIVSGSDYLVFDGLASSSKVVNAIDTTPDTVAGLSASFNGRIATFTFDQLDQPYVILVKARPTSETATGYFDSNETNTVRNTINMSAELWVGPSTNRDVTIVSRILDKTLTNIGDGILRWTVDYKPYAISQTGDRLADTLPVGIDLRTDANGNLILTDDYLTLNQLNLQSNGSYTLGTAVNLVIDQNVFYDNTTRVLTLLIPDNTQAYRFTYLTDVTGAPGTISNSVSLFGSTITQEETEQPYIITASDGTATLLRNGWIEITKLDGDANPLSNVGFTLYAADGITVIRTGVTLSDGKLKLRAIPDGSYSLKETSTPSGYVINDRTYSVVVSTNGTVVTTSIDGKTGENSNKLTVTNYIENTVGNLTITKSVAGNSADTTKEFIFTITFDNQEVYEYYSEQLGNGTITSGDTFILKHGESVTIYGIEKDTTYTVTEDDYTESGYVTTSTNSQGMIIADETITASFINTKNTTVITIEDPITPNTSDESQDGYILISLSIFSATLIALGVVYRYISKKEQEQ